MRIQEDVNKQGDSPALWQLHVVLQDGEICLEVVNVQSQGNDIGSDFSLHGRRD